MKYTPYESPFVREARLTALTRAKSAQQRMKKNTSSEQFDVTPAAYMTFPRPAVPRPPPRNNMSNRVWNSDHMRITANENGLFDPSLKKVEIFQIPPRSGAGSRRSVEMLLEEEERDMGVVDRTKENRTTHNRTVLY